MGLRHKTGRRDGADTLTLMKESLADRPMLQPKESVALAAQMQDSARTAADCKLTLTWAVGRRMPADFIGILLRAYLAAEDRRLALRNELVERNIMLVYKCAWKYVNRGLDLYDIVINGVFGLMHAIEKFEPQRGTTLSTYADQWIHQRIRQGFEHERDMIRIPKHLKEKMFMIARMREFMQQEFGRDIGDDELAEISGLSPESFKIAQEASCISVVDFEDMVRDDDHETVDYDVLPIATPEADEHPLFAAELSSRVREIIADAGLSEKEAMVLSLRYPLSDAEALAQKEIGTMLSISRERIRQIEEGALQKLRHRIITDASAREDLAPKGLLLVM